MKVAAGQMKPYRWCGRFYNNKQDSILWRLRNFVKSFCCVNIHHVAQFFKKKNMRRQVDIDPILTTFVNPVAQSIEPVITWLGHSTFLVQVAGVNILTDPMFFSGFPVFTRRLPLPITLEQLPKIDAVVISHNHKDHMDARSLRALKAHDPLFLVPMGNKYWFLWRGFKKIIEKSWWESEVVGGAGAWVSLSFLPAIHWSSRGILDVNKSLWGSWMIEVEGYKIYFAGDTAYGDHFTTIAQRYGPIDVAIMPIGPNEPRRYIAEAHVNSEEAVRAFIDLGARHFVPMHWGTFVRLGAECQDDPLAKLKEVWEGCCDYLLTHAMLHLVKCGEPIHLR